MARNLKAVLIAIFLIAGLFLLSKSHSSPIAQTKIRNVTVTLTDEPCAMTEKVDLPMRGYWDEGGKHYEGCWGGNQIGIVMMYFDDKSVAAFPAQVFKVLQAL